MNKKMTHATSLSTGLEFARPVTQFSHDHYLFRDDLSLQWSDGISKFFLNLGTRNLKVYEKMSQKECEYHLRPLKRIIDEKTWQP